MKTKITGGNPYLLAGVFAGNGIVNIARPVSDVLIVGVGFFAVKSLGKWYLVGEWSNSFDFCRDQLSSMIGVDDIRILPIYPESLKLDNITVKYC